MSNPLIPPMPLPDDERAKDAAVSEEDAQPVTTDDDGERTLDTDVDADQVDSAEADRVAAEGEDER
jgi:hypothetical protein